MVCVTIFKHKDDFVSDVQNNTATWGVFKFDTMDKAMDFILEYKAAAITNNNLSFVLNL